MTTQQLPPCLGDGVGGTSIWGKEELICTKHKPSEAETQTQFSNSDFMLFHAWFKQKHENSTDTRAALYGIFSLTKRRKVAKVLQELVPSCKIYTTV